MPRLNVGRLSLYFVDEGEGTPLVLLHAFPLNSSMWAPQWVPLSRFGIRIIAPDARGFGHSQPIPEVLTMEMIADDTAEIMNHLGIERAVIGGLSMGGYAALAFWRRHRKRVRGLVLADTRANADDDAGRLAREEFIAGALAHGTHWIAEQMMPKLQRSEPLPRIDSALRGLVRQSRPEAAAAAQRGMALRADFFDALPEIDCPVLVMVGEQDTLTPPALSRAMAERIPGARLVEIADAGHVPNAEAPTEFNEALSEMVLG
jgi:3-oxoadipate enol-lactonase